MKLNVKIYLPLIILVSALGGFFLMQISPAEPTLNQPKKSDVIAEYVVATPQSFNFKVFSRGTVAPAIETELTAEVAGRIVTIAEGMYTGGIFSKGELLFEIDSQEYQDEIIEAEAELASCHSNLAKEEAHAKQAKMNWKILGKGEPSKLALRSPQLAESQAAVRAATARLNRAKRNLDKTKIRAPYDLMIQSKHINLNGYITPGSSLAHIFSLDAVDIRLPLTQREISQVGLVPPTLKNKTVTSSPEVTLTTQIAGRKYYWLGRIVRSENMYDPKSRVTYVVARVKDPYGIQTDPVGVPLAVGMFVQAEIKGEMIENKIVIPKNALHESDTVWIIKDDNTLTERRVETHHSREGYSVIEDGLKPGDKICINNIPYFAENMLVKPVRAVDVLPGATSVKK